MQKQHVEKQHVEGDVAGDVAQNVDQEEIRKFSDQAARWWDVNSEFKPLHDINPLRLDFINQRSPLQGKKVLDVGCGGGILSESMAIKGAQVTGIDMAQAPLDVARLHAVESGIKVQYSQSTAESLANSMPQQWDIVTCMEMLEHVPEPKSVVRACAELVRPGGSVYFSTLNRNPKSFLFAIVAAEYLLNLLPRGTHQYEKFIKPSELSEWAEQSDLELKDIIGVHFNPLIARYHLGVGVDVNYIMHTIRAHR